MSIYMCIDLKSFYASVECRERGLDPLNTNLVVADSNRTEKTICLAVTPSLKSYGIPGRARLYEVIQKVGEVNLERKKKNYNRKFSGKSYFDSELKNNYSLELDFIKATPRMKLYMKYSSNIYKIYLKYIAPEDILVYSIDEVFCDITHYLKMYNKTPEELVCMMIKDVYDNTGITATAGIGTNMYLAKVAMDITAKHMAANEFGVRLAYLDEDLYKKTLWEHTPLTDFWRVGRGYVKKLNEYKMYTMGDVARCSIENEDLLYKLFGVNAEFLIDHAWGYEPCTIKDAKAYKPQSNSLSSGQVLHCPYNYDKCRLIVKEMVDSLVLELVRKGFVCSQFVLTVQYDVECLKERIGYNGPVTTDGYGRKIPKPAHGTINLDHFTSSSRIITEYVLRLFDKIVDHNLLFRKIYVVAANIIKEDKIKDTTIVEQMDLFTDYDKKEEEKKIISKKENDDKKVQDTILEIQNKYGKNSILKGMNFQEGATAKDRNESVGGHRG